MKKHALTALLAISLLSMPAAGAMQGHTTPPEPAAEPADLDSASAYLESFRELEGQEAFTTYSEFEVVRSQAVFGVQIGEFTEREDRRMGLVLALLQRFQTAYEKQQAGEFGPSLEAANETAAIADQLQAVQGGGRYAALASVALDRFYARTGQSLQSAAEAEQSTPERIQTLQRAALAYQRAGASDRYSQVLIRVDGLQRTYAADLSEINQSVAATNSFMESCAGCGGFSGAIAAQGLNTFSRYQAAMTAGDEIRTAIGIAEEHGIDRVESLRTLRSELGAVRISLAVASVTLILGYTVLVGAVAVAVGWRLSVWRRDLEAAAHGDSILVGAMLRD